MQKNKKIEEALNLFSELQTVPFVDIDDENRIRGTSHQFAPKKPNNSTSLIKGSGSGGGKGTSVLHGKLEKLRNENVNLQRKITISDAIMKKLHKKNKELESRNTKLSIQLALAGKEPVEDDQHNNNGLVATMTTNLPPSQLQEMITRRDAEIINLRKQLTAAVQIHESPNIPVSQSSISDQSIRNMCREMLIPSSSNFNGNEVKTPYYLNHRIDKLEKDYQALLDVKLEYISEGETTGKVNKEVKKFFSHLKEKLVSNEKDWEIERVMWQEQVFELEQRISELTHTAVLLQDTLTQSI